MQEFDKVLQIQLDDGRTIIARPSPEDQERLDQVGREARLSLGPNNEYDIAGHGLSSDLEIDVEGHAMTLRLPTPGDAEAVRRLLVAGALTATIVAAGTIAALQSPPSTTTTSTGVTAPAPGARPNADFRDRREQAVDDMLSAPVPLAQPSDVSVEGVERVAPGGASLTSTSTSSQAKSGTPSSTDLRDRREQASDKLLEAPEPLPQPGDVELN